MKAVEKYGQIPAAVRYDLATAALDAAHTRWESWRVNLADPRDGTVLRARLEAAREQWNAAVAALSRAVAQGARADYFQPTLFEAWADTAQEA
ncbi:hypothetical protein L1785_12195 [Antribacter sp. KLBMP9083]|uniref:Uncharacterized protein n=1 Tax=Antribacter soli TaxID=2910976 RepID=A0AA41QE15_9MICO|nr:hypothetical protein [Antribacter soli]MCF4121744.1 hypothetical protein [Antribacter soli]